LVLYRMQLKYFSEYIKGSQFLLSTKMVQLGVIFSPVGSFR